MEWWAIGGVLGTWLTLRGWLRSKRSGRDARNFPHFSPSSPRTEVRPTLPALDPDKVGHTSRCHWCRATVPVLLSETRLESQPWRLVWRCRVCGNVSRARVHDDALEFLLGQDRAGGMPLSTREVERFVGASEDEWDAALREEIL